MLLHQFTHPLLIVFVTTKLAKVGARGKKVSKIEVLTTSLESFVAVRLQRDIYTPTQLFVEKVLKRTVLTNPITKNDIGHLWMNLPQGT